MRLVFALFVLLVCALARAAEGPQNFKGVSVGDTEEQVKAAFPKASCEDKKATISDRVCHELTTIAGVKSTVIFFFIHGKVDSIHLVYPSQDFSRIAAA